MAVTPNRSVPRRSPDAPDRRKSTVGHEKSSVTLCPTSAAELPGTWVKCKCAARVFRPAVGRRSCWRCGRAIP